MNNQNSKNLPPSQPPTLSPSASSVAFLWDESFLWGIMAYKTLTAGGLAFDLVRSEDIRNGRLKNYAMLFVPGGWASNKLKALGDDGVREIKSFVHGGGAYLGFCGGAGLATLDGIGLVPVRRKPTRERVPSFSGPIRLDMSGHPLWEGIAGPVFHAWWPSQFIVGDGSVAVLAAYGEAMPGSFSSDVNVGDAALGCNWAELERIYQINLDPGRMLRDPAVLEGTFGKGKVVLSLVHFDTPGDRNGAAVLTNLWQYLAPNANRTAGESPSPSRGGKGVGMGPGGRHAKGPHFKSISELEAAVSDLISLGERNFLWYWRNSMLLQWRRGVRGLEYCTLYIMVKELSGLLGRQDRGPAIPDLEAGLVKIRELLLPFADRAKQLLLRERYAMQHGHITYEKCDDPAIQAIREELFSRSKSHGGAFKILIDEIDGFLFRVLTGYAHGT